MNISSASITFSSEFFSQPPTAGASGTFRAIASDRVEFAADSAIKLNLLPTSTTTYTINNFPAVQLGGAAIININGYAASFAKIKGIHIRVSAYDPDSASSGTVSVTITDLFNRIQGPANQVLLVLVAAGLAPLGEEALFRGLLLPALTRRVGLIGGVAISAALFALLHFNAFAFLPLFAFGLALGAAYWMTGSLLVPILMHAVFNAVNSTLLMVLPAGF